VTLFLYADGRDHDVPAERIEFRRWQGLEDPEDGEITKFDRHNASDYTPGRVTTIYVERGYKPTPERISKAIRAKYGRKPLLRYEPGTA
jgi:hypothetical protein